MNLIERVITTVGKYTGLYESARQKQFPSVSDPTAWMDPVMWGPGLTEKRLPRTPEEMVQQFTSWVYACASLNATTLSSVPLRLYVGKTDTTEKFTTITTKRLKPERKTWLETNVGLQGFLRKSVATEEVTEHRFLDLMRTVNPFHNQYDLMEITSVFLDLTGEAYWWLNTDRTGLPFEIWTVPSQYIRPVPGRDLKNWIQAYHYRKGSTEFDIPAEEILYFSLPNPKNEYRGFSCIAGVVDAVYINSKMAEFEGAMFEKKATISGVWTTETGTPVDKATFDRLEQKVEQKYSGARNAGRSIIAAGGLKFTPNVMTPQELNYVQGRKLIREEIAAAFGVPISCLVATDVNRANAEVADYRHAKNAILPRLRRIEQKLNEKMLPLFDDKLFVAFDNPVADDKEYGFKKTAEFLARGVYTINDVRGDEGMDDAEWGDMPWLPSTLTQVGQEPPTPAIPTIVVNPEGSEQDAEAVPASDSGAQPVEEMADMVLEKVRERLGA